LIRTRGSREAFREATRALTGVDDTLEGIAFAGRTDPLILADIMARHQRTLTAEETERFWQIARARMETLLAGQYGVVLPGVEPLLQAIGREPAWISALLTGNTAAMARLKLGSFGLTDSFVFGAFGDEAPDRDALACQAVAEAGARWGVAPQQCVIVGDTELDIACARAAGAKVVAVTTGTRTRADLEPSAPDLLLDDLSNPTPLLAWARAIGENGGGAA
jgi:phosphoglycolate phosphatase-like HAD superfamily hydrolase